MRTLLAIILVCIGCDNSAAIIKDDTTLADPPKDKVEQVLGTPAEIKPYEQREQQRGQSKISVNTIGELNCQVRYGRRDMGGAPLFGQEVAPGRVIVDIRCPSGKGYATPLVVAWGDDAKLIIRPDMFTPLAERSALVIRSEPRAVVLIDQIEIGETPLQVDVFSPGSHEVTVMADGYGRQTRGVQLEAGRPTMAAFTLLPVDPRGTGLDHSAAERVKSPNP